MYTAPHGRSLADRDAAYIVIPHAPPAPLIGHSDHPVLGLTGASTTSQVDVKCLAKADRGDRWCYHPGQETADDLLALQDESRKAVSGGAIFNSTPPTAKGQPPHSMARVASYMLVPGQSKTVTMAYSNKKATDLPCLLALGQRRLLEVQEAYPNDTLHILFGAYVHRDVELCGLAQHLHRDLDREANKSHPAFSSFTAIVGSTPPDHEQQGFFVPRSACGLPCPWVELPMPATPGKSLTIDSFIAHCGGAQPPGLEERGCVAVFGFSTERFLDYSKTVAVYRPLWASNGPGSTQPLWTGPNPNPQTPPARDPNKFTCSSCSKYVSVKKGFCCGCSTMPVCEACLLTAQKCDMCRNNPDWHLHAVVEELGRGCRFTFRGGIECNS